MKVVRQIARDSIAIGRALMHREPTAIDVGRALMCDGTIALAMFRVRKAALRWHVPFVNGALRRAQTVLFGMEVSRHAELGEGVVFLHTVGIVIGGDARIGRGVLFLGSNTIGSVGNSGYPTIEDDVVIGAGARVLGSVKIQDFSKLDREQMEKLSGYDQMRGKLRQVMKSVEYPEGYFYVERTLALLFGLVGQLAPKQGLPGLVMPYAMQAFAMSAQKPPAAPSTPSAEGAA